MSTTTDLLKAKQLYIAKNKVYPNFLSISIEFQKELNQDTTYKKKSASNGAYYLGCNVKVDDTLIEPFIFSGGEHWYDQTNN